MLQRIMLTTIQLLTTIIVIRLIFSEYNTRENMSEDGIIKRSY